MNTFITPLKQVLTPARTRNSRSLNHLNGMLAAFRCMLVTLSVFAGIVQAQQPDPLTITKDGKVGIGTTSPANKLSVAGDADVSGNVGIGTAKPVNKLSVAGNADVSGNVGIGTTTPTNKLSVVGNSDFSGNVGIGAASPSEKLHVNGAIRVDDASLKFFGGGNLKGFAGPGRNNDFSLVAKDNAKWLRLGANKGGIALWANGNAETGDTPQFLLNADGNVGIGTATPANRLTVIGNVNFDGNVGIGVTTPTHAKLQISGAIDSYVTQYGYLKSSGQTGNYSAFTKINYSIWASHNIGAIEFHSFSDARIKNIHGRSDSATDLRTLLGLEITDYRHKDVIAKGNGTYKKVTGQQVEKVFPQAVSKHTEVVPDIYQPASVRDGWVTLATDLKKGERVRLIGEKSEGIHEVLEVAEGKFRTDFKPEGSRVFVYGREVKDFLTVDYEAISMLNVSATQQIKKEKDEEVKVLQEENVALRSQLAAQEKRLAELEAKDKTRDEKLAAIEARVLSVDKSAAGTASLKKVE